MPALIQICIVIVTIGLLATAWMAVRTLSRVGKAAEDFSLLSHAMRESIAQVDRVAHEARELVGLLQDCVPPVLRVMDRFEAIGQRTADLSSTVLDEIELPVFAAAAVARGVKSGANHLLKRLMDRFTHRHTPIPGGYDHE